MRIREVGSIAAIAIGQPVRPRWPFMNLEMFVIASKMKRDSILSTISLSWANESLFLILLKLSKMLIEVFHDVEEDVANSIRCLRRVKWLRRYGRRVLAVGY